jgi:Xaa-Pro aminopeptidase
MFHYADHTMSNALAMVGLWDEEFHKLNKMRLAKGLSDTEWRHMREAAEADEESFLKALRRRIENDYTQGA